MRFLLALLFLPLTLFSSSINVATAANVSYAMDELIHNFNQHYPKIKVYTTIGSSGKLTAQIKNKAPYDILLSANMKYPQTLFEEGLAINEPIIYAKGALALFSKKEQDFSLGLKLLDNSKRIALANSKTAPYGIAAVQALKNAKLYEKHKSKFIYGESIAQTLSYAMLAADISLVAKSSLYSTKMARFKEGVHYTQIDTNLYEPINQGIVVLKHSKNLSDAQRFYDYILSSEAQKILVKYGYMINE